MGGNFKEEALPGGETRNRILEPTPFMDSRAWKVTRMVLLVTTGGLCAGLSLFLNDRQWVAGLPWTPAPTSSIVEVPVRESPVRTKALDPADPFLLEDPSELETHVRNQPLPPLALPEPRTIPVAAGPITAAKKLSPESN